MNSHELKLSTEFFPAVAQGIKTFEIRKNDRGYELGDILILSEWELTGHFYTGRKLIAEITYITNYAQQDNYIVMGIKLVKHKLQVEYK